MHLGILGAGHAGIEAAVAARAAGVDVTVFSNEAVLPYFRPRLVAVAMGQTAPEAIAMHPASWYAERGITLRVDAPVASFDPAHHTVTAAGVSARFDALVLACGAIPVRPRFAGETPDTPVATLWSMAQALAILPLVRQGGRLVVIGGGILGIECALRATESGMRVEIVEKLPRLLPLLLGVDAAALLRAQMEAKGVKLHLDRAVAGVSPAGAGATVRLDDGVQLESDLVLVCIGARPDLALAQQAGLATGRGVITDSTLQARPGLFVAGDVCQVGERAARGSVREASAQGRVAGANAAAWMAGKPLQPFAFELSPVGLRYGGVEVWAAGCACGDGTTEHCLEGGASAGAYRAVTRCGERVVGVQMIGTREGFDAWVQSMSSGAPATRA